MIAIPLLCILLLSPSVLTQFAADSVQPDVTFGEGNDRYDLTSMIKATNRMYHENQLTAEEEDTRRNLNSDEDDLGMVDEIGVKKSKSKFNLIPDRRSGDFAYHDKMETHEEANVDFESSLSNFMSRRNKKNGRRMAELVDYLHGNKPGSRRSDTPHSEQEVLMHYAMPIVMTIDGFMKVPLE